MRTRNISEVLTPLKTAKIGHLVGLELLDESNKILAPMKIIGYLSDNPRRPYFKSNRGVVSIMDPCQYRMYDYDANLFREMGWK